MEIKKYPDAVLENYSKVLMLLGLVLALFMNLFKLNRIQDLLEFYQQLF